MMAELLNKCQAGDQDAIGMLVNRFRCRALDLAGALLGDEHLAHDAVQEAFLSALEHLSGLREPDAFWGWFRQVIRTQCNRMLRRNRERPSPVVPDCPATQMSVRESLELDERRRAVRNAMTALSPAGRETARLFYLEEWSCSAIAEHLEVPAGTVKRRLHDARKQLRDMLLGRIPSTAVPRPPGRPRARPIPF